MAQPLRPSKYISLLACLLLPMAANAQTARIDLTASGQDDTSAFVNAATNIASGGVIRVHGGIYSATICQGKLGGQARFLMNLSGKSGLRVLGDGPGITIINTTSCATGQGAYIFDFSPWATDQSLIPTTSFVKHKVYPMLAARLGQNYVDLVNPGDAATFYNGGLIFIRTGQYGPGVDVPDAETETIGSIAGNRLFLKHTLRKSYAQQCYESGSSGQSSTACAGRVQAPMGVSAVQNLATYNIEIGNMTVNGDQFSTIINDTQVIGESVHDLTGTIGTLGGGGEGATGIRDSSITIAETNTNGGDAIASSGVSDVVSSHVEYDGIGPLTIQINEGSTDVLIINDKFVATGNWLPGIRNNVLAARGGCHNISIQNSTFINDTGDAVVRFDKDFDPGQGCERVSVSGSTFSGSANGEPAAAYGAALNPVWSGNTVIPPDQQPTTF
jgi:hypothetical protein